MQANSWFLCEMNFKNKQTVNDDPAINFHMGSAKFKLNGEPLLIAKKETKLRWNEVFITLRF